VAGPKVARIFVLRIYSQALSAGSAVWRRLLALGEELKRGGVHAVSHLCWRGPVGKHVPKVPVTSRAPRFDAPHPVACVDNRMDV
jgi:hypothetical protein